MELTAPEDSLLARARHAWSLSRTLAAVDEAAGVASRGLDARIYVDEQGHARVPEGLVQPELEPPYPQPSFMQYLRANLSKKVGRLVDWSGGFWERRYSAEPVLDDTALVGRLRYVLAHGVKEGLVERSAEWPGLTCLPQLLGPARRLFQWFNWTKRWSKRGSEDMATGEGRFAEEIAEPVELEVAPLPCWEAQHPHTRPERLKRSPRPLGHASTRQALKQLREQYRAFIAAFREAAAQWTRGNFAASFPLFSFPPRVVPGRVARVL